MSERHLKLHERFSKLTPRQKLEATAIIVICLIILFFSIAYLSGKLYIFMSVEEATESPFHYGFNQFLTITLTVFSFTAFGIVYRIYTGRRNTVTETDDRGVKHMARGTHGTSRFATDKEIENKFNITDIEDTNEMIYGQLQKDGHGKETISFKAKEHGGEGNRSAIVIATSGAGKSYSQVSGNIIKAVERNHSLAIVDPSGELYSKLGHFCRLSNYDVKLLNLKNLDYSDYWNCLWETIDEKTGRLESSRLRSFANIFMRNSAEVKGQDFWYECAQNLIEATIGLVAVRREQKILDQYVQLFQKITSTKRSAFKKITEEQFVSFPWCEDEIRKEVRKRWKEKKDIPFESVERVNEIFEKIKASAPKFTIDEVYKTINKVASKEIEAEFENLPAYHPAKAAYDRYIGVVDKDKKNGDAVIKGAIQGAQLKFKIFDDHKLREVLSNDGINFNTINKIPSAYFVAIPDTDDSYTPIASLFFSFFFKDVQENYDYEESLRIKEKRENKCIPVMAMLDEFASLGVLTGSEKLFSTYMSDMRKRKLYAWIVIQYYSQLEGIYGEYAKDGILSNCATTLYLGGNDANTLEFISEKSGTATVMMESHQTIDTFIKKYEDEKLKVQETYRKLLTTDEAGMIEDKVLILKQGCHPFFANVLPWTDAPEYVNGLCEEHSYFENIDSLEDRIYERERNKQDIDIEAEIYKDITNIFGGEEEAVIEANTQQNNDNPPPAKEPKQKTKQKTKKQEEKKETPKPAPANNVSDQWVIKCLNAYDIKDKLRIRSYRYYAEETAWWKSIKEEDMQKEIDYLTNDLKHDISNIVKIRQEDPTAKKLIYNKTTGEIIENKNQHKVSSPRVDSMPAKTKKTESELIQ